MAHNRIDCEQFKPTNKNGQKEKCHCKYLNRKWGLRMKLDKMYAKLESARLNKKG